MLVKGATGISSNTAHTFNMFNNSQTERIPRASPTNSSVEPLKWRFQLFSLNSLHRLTNKKYWSFSPLTSCEGNHRLSMRWTHTQGCSNEVNHVLTSLFQLTLVNCSTDTRQPVIASSVLWCQSWHHGTGDPPSVESLTTENVLIEISLVYSPALETESAI